MTTLEKRIMDLQTKIGLPEGFPPIAMEDKDGLYHIPDHSPMTRTEWEKFNEPWDKAGIPAIVICGCENGERFTITGDNEASK